MPLDLPRGNAARVLAVGTGVTKTEQAMSTKRSADGHARRPEDQTSFAEKALAAKNSAPKAERPSTPTSRKGMRPIPNEDIAPEGALEAEGRRPALGRARGR